jgi:transcriptional regulator with XRE-family HTH domain
MASPQDLFRDRMRRLRGLRGMTQEDLAVKAGVSIWSLCRMENGRSAITLDSAAAIAAALDATVDTMAGEGTFSAQVR